MAVTRAVGAALALFLAASAASTASAQVGAEAPSDSVPPAPSLADTVDAPSPGVHTNEDDIAPVEGAEGDDDGPLPTLFDITDRLVALTLYLGFPGGTDFTDGLAALGYGDSPRFWGASATMAWKAIAFLWIGGQVDLRTRVWERDGLTPATAILPSGLVVLDARFPLNSVLELGVRVGGGFGAMVLDMNGTPNVTGVPRLHAALQFGVTIYEPLRLYFQLAADYAESLAVNDIGDTVSFSVASLGLGLEGRL